MTPDRQLKSTSIDSLPPDVQERLAKILEEYLSQLEQGGAPSVEELVKQHPDIAEPLRDFLTSVDFLHDAAAGFRTPKETPAADSTTSAGQLGDYRLIREVGRGGMGVVYEAKQITLDRRVALKVLPFAAVLDQRQIARFKNEAQAAAHLQHPNIVPVYSVGCDRGVHYYAMQYVEGQSLDGAIRQLRASTTAPGVVAPPDPPPEVDADADTRRSAAATWKSFSGHASLRSREFYRTAARIGAEAAEALEHAHQCGVIHRDVKPSNLLVDNRGKVWITDFGLAHFETNANLTVTGDVMGTFRYMSPEQATGKKGWIDGRTDVYSLGVTLYELCTLTSVFEESDRQLLLQQIVNQDPPNPRQVNPAIPVDLETILLKAMSKSLGDRYATAGELADDLRRFLHGEPIAARRASLADRAGKWARRHKNVVAGAIALFGLILIGSLVSTLLIADQHAKTRAALAQSEVNRKTAEENFRRAEENRQRAETHFRQLREVVDRFGARYAERLKGLPGAEPIRQELLTDTLKYYRGFIQHAGDDPTVRDVLATTWSKAAAINERVGNKGDAVEDLRRAAAIFRELAEAQSDEPKYRADWALCQNNLGALLGSLGKHDEAQAAYEQAVDAQKRLVGEHPDVARFRSDLASTWNNLGLLATEERRPSQAKQTYLEAIKIQKDLVDEFPDEPGYRHDLAISYNNLSFLYAKTDPVKAQQASEQSLVIQQGLVKAHPGNVDYRSDLALNYNNLGALQNHNSHPDEAESSYRKAIALLEQLVRKSPTVVRYRYDLAVSYSNLGRVYSQSRQLRRAKEAFERARDITQNLVHDYAGQLIYRSTLGGVLNNLGDVFEQLGQTEDALDAYRRAIEHQRFAFENAPQVAQFRTFLEKHYDHYHRLLRAGGHWKEDLETAAEQRELFRDASEDLYGLAADLVMVGAAAADDNGEGKPHPNAEIRKDYTRVALDTLRQAVDAGLERAGRIRRDPRLSGVRKHPDYERLLKRLPPGD
jgi:serine/threonine protein kinase/Tfp pilus assembly protein PilF